MGIIENALTAQGVIQPGTGGYWRVFGARAQDIVTGDMVITDSHEFQVGQVVRRRDLRDIVCPAFLGTDGKTYHVGALQPIVVLRHGTRHILAPSI